VSDYKKTKMGKVPGDVSVQEKARMLEGKSERLTQEQQKAYKKEHTKKANRRLRRQKIEE
jgi:hypothetical protein